MFNSYCRAAVAFEEAARAGRSGNPELLPAFASGPLRVTFSGAGLLVDCGPCHYTIVSWRKGGVCYHYKDGRASIQDVGVVVRDDRDRHYSSQADDPDIEFSLDQDRLVIHPRLTRARQMLPTPVMFIVMRVLCVTAFRVPALSRALKRVLVRLLITGKQVLPVRLRRTIHLGPDLVIHDEPSDFHAYGLQRCDSRRFSAIHMASQGYWQAGDDRS
jgi:hypothetical protein